MPEVYLCRTFLPNEQEAVAHGVKDDLTDYFAFKSIVRIRHKETKKSTQEFEIEGKEIATMHYIHKNKFLAISAEGENEIFIYDLSHKKMVKVLDFLFHVQSLTTTEESLIVGAGGSLYIYNSSLILQKYLKIADVVSGLHATDRFILCDTFTKTEDTSQVKLFDKSSGAFLRDIGSPRICVKIKNCFLGFLDENTLFTAIPKQFTCDIDIYDSETGKQKNHLEITNGDSLFVFALPHGNIAVYCSNKTVNVYSALDCSVLFTGISDITLRLKEDMILFVSNNEKETLPVLAKGIMDILGTMGLFPKGVAHMIRDYAVSYQALDHATVDKLLPKPSMK